MKEGLNNVKKILKNGTFREKVEYFWDYYKWHFIVFLLIIGILGNIIYTNMTAKEYVLQGIFLNSTGGAEAALELEQDLLKFSIIDTEKEGIFFSTDYFFSDDPNSQTAANSYEMLQMLAVKIAAGEIDFVIGDLATMSNLAYSQYYYELPELLSEELLKKYESYFVYYDSAFMEELENEDTILENPTVYPDPQRPDLMEEPVPIFIDVSECEKLQGIYPYANAEYVMAFTVNGVNMTKALEFLAYLME